MFYIKSGRIAMLSLSCDLSALVAFRHLLSVLLSLILLLSVFTLYIVRKYAILDAAINSLCTSFKKTVNTSVPRFHFIYPQSTMVVLQALSEYLVKRPPPSKRTLKVELNVRGRKSIQWIFLPKVAHKLQTAQVSI